jgi:hypothetical protein
MEQRASGLSHWSTKRGASGRISRYDLLGIWRRQGGQCNGDVIIREPQCAICRNELDTRGSHGFHIDHILCIKASGGTTTDNLQLLCSRCHNKKSARERFLIKQNKNFRVLRGCYGHK